MTRIFLSYRRDDSKYVTARINDKLEDAFGNENTFIDVDDIPIGANFPKVLSDTLNQSDAVIIIIGPKWADIRENDNPELRRLHNPDDFVRIEVEKALKNPDVVVIPVLVKGASMPNPVMLPDSIHPLTEIQSHIIRDNPHFKRDTATMIEAIREAVVVRAERIRQHEIEEARLRKEVEEKKVRQQTEEARLQKEAEEEEEILRQQVEKERLQKETEAEEKKVRQQVEEARLQKEAEELRQQAEKVRLQKEAEEKEKKVRQQAEEARLQKEAEEEEKARRYAIKQQQKNLSNEVLVDLLEPIFTLEDLKLNRDGEFSKKQLPRRDEKLSEHTKSRTRANVDHFVNIIYAIIGVPMLLIIAWSVAKAFNFPVMYSLLPVLFVALFMLFVLIIYIKGENKKEQAQEQPQPHYTIGSISGVIDNVHKGLSFDLGEKRVSGLKCKMLAKEFRQYEGVQIRVYFIDKRKSYYNRNINSDNLLSMEVVPPEQIIAETIEEQQSVQSQT